MALVGGRDRNRNLSRKVGLQTGLAQVCSRGPISLGTPSTQAVTL